MLVCPNILETDTISQPYKARKQEDVVNIDQSLRCKFLVQIIASQIET